MKIKLDDKHYLNSDAFCYWITCDVELQSGKSKGSTVERRVSGYRPTFEGAVESFIDKYVSSAEIESYEFLVREIRKLKKLVKGWKVAVERGE